MTQPLPDENVAEPDEEGPTGEDGEGHEHDDVEQRGLEGRDRCPDQEARRGEPAREGSPRGASPRRRARPWRRPPRAWPRGPPCGAEPASPGGRRSCRRRSRCPGPPVPKIRAASGIDQPQRDRREDVGGQRGGVAQAAADREDRPPRGRARQPGARRPATAAEQARASGQSGPSAARTRGDCAARAGAARATPLTRAPGRRRPIRATRRPGSARRWRCPRLARDPGQLAGEGGVVGGPDDEAVVLERHARHRRAGHDRCRQRPVVGRPQQNAWGRSVMRRRISRKSPEAARRPATTTRTRSATRSTSSRMCEEKRIVRPAAGQVAEEVHHVEPLARIHPVEGLVEDEHARDRGRGPRPPWPAGASPSSRCRARRSAAGVSSTVASARSTASAGRGARPAGRR